SKEVGICMVHASLCGEGVFARVFGSVYLLKQRHGKLLVGDAVLGRADVLFGLIGDVEVDSHQEVLLQGEQGSVCYFWKQYKCVCVCVCVYKCVGVCVRQRDICVCVC